MQKTLVASGAALGGLAVILGAFAAHGLKSKLAPSMLEVFHTGVEYQFYHALALLAAGILGSRWAGICFLIGIVLFSGSLYAMSALNAPLGIVTPIGGLFFIAGWILLLIKVIKKDN